mmetsp:Transcript_19849/g.66775  ORF Transcript_19849/g.66775 Transcript_19849/m.66775 type:complete len:300 (-) Transcript_19849:85-984(-)
MDVGSPTRDGSWMRSTTLVPSRAAPSPASVSMGSASPGADNSVSASRSASATGSLSASSMMATPSGAAILRRSSEASSGSARPCDTRCSYSASGRSWDWMRRKGQRMRPCCRQVRLITVTHTPSSREASSMGTPNRDAMSGKGTILGLRPGLVCRAMRLSVRIGPVSTAAAALVDEPPRKAFMSFPSADLQGWVPPAPTATALMAATAPCWITRCCVDAAVAPPAEKRSAFWDAEAPAAPFAACGRKEGGGPSGSGSGVDCAPKLGWSSCLGREGHLPGSEPEEDGGPHDARQRSWVTP